MRDLINQYAQAQFDAQDDAAVLAILNEKTETIVTTNFQLSPGYCSNTAMAKALTPDAAGYFESIIVGTIAQLSTGSELEKAKGVLIDGLLTTYRTEGLNFADETIRQNLEQIWGGIPDPGPLVPIETYLALGYTIGSKAEKVHGRDATQEDLDAIRQEDSNEQYEVRIDEHSYTAYQLFVTRFSSALQANTQWDDATQAAEWAKAWSDVSI